MAFSNPVVGGEGGELIRDSIKSPNFVAGVSGWIIRRDGSAEFNNVNIRFDLTAGSIVVGPNTGPQVIIRYDGTHGTIEFPTNRPIEDRVAFIRSRVVSPGTAAENLMLELNSPTTDNGGDWAYLELDSGEDSPGLQRWIGGVTNSIGPQKTEIEITEPTTVLYSPEVQTDNELFIGTNEIDANYPERIVAGKVASGTTTTAIGTGAATAIGGAGMSSVRLVDQVVYECNVSVPLSAVATSSAAGTQRVTWSLWRGAVGTGTRVGNLNRKFKVGAVGAMQEDVSLSFLWVNTVADGTYALNLAAQHTQGTDSLQAIVNSEFFIEVERKGLRSMYENL